MLLGPFMTTVHVYLLDIELHSMTRYVHFENVTSVCSSCHFYLGVLCETCLR